MRRVAALAAAFLVGLICVAPAHATGSLRLGFFDWRPLTGPDSATWLPKAQQVGAQVVRVTTYWRDDAPVAPKPGFDANNPADPQYRWSALDGQIKTLQSAGIDVLLTVQRAPAWAEGPARPSTAEAPSGTWKPDAQQLAAFFTALATRYSGTFPDPAGGTLPAVDQFQVWNEPNLFTYLTPQWTKTDKGYAITSPNVYRQMLNASYAAIKRVQPNAEVLSAGTAPYGDLQAGGRRIGPVLFDRTLLCLQGQKLKKTSCPDPVHFDAWDHHSYGVSAPTRPAANPLDVATPDIGKLSRIVRKAVSVGTALPRASKPIWMTEVSYDSNPPDPDGVPIKQQAAWLEQSFQLLDDQGVHNILWFSITDMPPTPSYDTTYQSGLFFLDGTPKPAATAFTFPFVHRKGRVWGRAPIAGRLIVERHRGSAWKTIRTATVRTHEVFDLAVEAPRSAILRARVGTQTSLTWPVT